MSDILVHSGIVSLQELLKKQDEQTKKLIKLTRWIVILTVVMTIVVLVQVIKMFLP